MKAKRSSNRLYMIIMEEENATCLLSKAEETSWLLHLRLGHVNFGAMNMKSSGGVAPGITHFTQPNDFCSGCLLSKQTR